MFLTILLTFLKCYISPDAIEITEQSIVVHDEGESFEVNAICVDEKGTYCYKPLNPKNTCQFPNEESDTP